jgi:hypothetical protein
MRGELAFWVLMLSPALMAPKGCYFGSDVVPLGYNATGGGGSEAGAPDLGDAGEGNGAAPNAEQGGSAATGGASEWVEGGASGSSGGSNAFGGSGGAGSEGHGGTTVIVLRPH